ncbi:aminotransferase class V-fold PLP-dependent enzyme, partial [Salmonella enterica subsp. enterica serovar Infantis]
RAKSARLLKAPHEKSIVWTRGTTEAINIVAPCYAPPRLRPGDENIVSVAQHHANQVPWLMVAPQTGAPVKQLPLHHPRLPEVE